MGHVGEELGFVFRGKRQLGSFFLKCVAGLFDLGVLAFDFGIFALDFSVLPGEQPGLGAQLFIGLLKLALAGLQLNRQLLRLREQPFGTHRRFDGIEHRAYTLREQIEKCQRPGTEFLQRSQLNDCLYPSLKQHRQHNNAHLPGIAETAGN